MDSITGRKEEIDRVKEENKEKIESGIVPRIKRERAREWEQILKIKIKKDTDTVNSEERGIKKRVAERNKGKIWEREKVMRSNSDRKKEIRSRITERKIKRIRGSYGEKYRHKQSARDNVARINRERLREREQKMELRMERDRRKEKRR